MPGWDSLETVARIQSGAQIAVVVLLALLAAGAVLLFRQLRRGRWPTWIDIGSYQVRNVAGEIAVASILVVLTLMALVAIGYGIRQSALIAEAEQTHADELRRVVEEARVQAEEAMARLDQARTRQDETRVGSAAENPAQQQQHLRELADLQRKLTEGANQIADLRRKLADTERQLTELQRRPAEADGQLSELRRKLTDSESQAVDLRRKLADTERQLTELQRRPAEADDQLSELRRKLTDSESQVGDLRRKLADAEHQVSDGRRKATERDSQVADLQRKLTEGENQVTDLRRRLADTERQLAESPRNPTETQGQVAELRRKLTETESELTDLKRKEMRKRLSEDEKKVLVTALTPFAGQKVAVAARVGDDDSKALAEDFVSVFDAAHWDRGGAAGISMQNWDRDPVGVEIALNEADARAGRISNGVGALINAVRRLGLTYDNTIYMTPEVPSGQAVVKVGRMLRK
jgi:DNA repair exonuclease SbcCD ATPase subunit